MKHKILLTTLCMGIGLVVLSSYKDGPAHGGLGNRSGSGAAANTCSNAGCHGSQNANLALVLTLTDDATGTPVTDGTYTPGHVYSVSLVGTYSGTAAYTHLGFQASIVNAASTSTGTLAATSTSTATINSGSVQLIEHITPIPKTGSNFTAGFKWTAPAAGAGTARVFARMVANNNNETPGDDTPNAISATFTEAGGTTSITDVKKNDAFKIYPNPAQNQLNIKLNTAISGKYTMSIRSIEGKTLMNTVSEFSSGTTTLNIATLAKGVYTLSIQYQNELQTVRFVKK